MESIWLAWLSWHTLSNSESITIDISEMIAMVSEEVGVMPDWFTKDMVSRRRSVLEGKLNRLT